jgi:hypothetical protein
MFLTLGDVNCASVVTDLIVGKIVRQEGEYIQLRPTPAFIGRRLSSPWGRLCR